MTTELSALELSILRDEEELAKLEGKNAEATEVEDIVDQATEEVEQDEEPEQATDDLETNSQDSDDEPAPKNNSDWAKMRVKLKERDAEAAKLRNDLEFLKGQVAAVTQPKTVAPEPEPVKQQFDKEFEFEKYADQKIDDTEKQVKKTQEEIENLRNQMASELMQLKTQRAEAEAERNNPGYLDAKKLLEQKSYDILYREYKSNMRLQFPNRQEEEIDQYLKQNSRLIQDAAKGQVNNVVSKSVMLGKDVADTIIDYAKVYGYDAVSSVKSPLKAEPKTNLEKIKANMKKSPSLINGGAGKGKADDRLTAEQITAMTLEQCMELSESDWNL